MNLLKIVGKIAAIAFTGVVILGLLGLAALKIYLDQQPANGPNEITSEIYLPAPAPGSSLNAIEADAEIKIPGSAREIHAMISGFRELDTWVRLDLPAEDLHAFLQNARCTSALYPSDPLSHGPGKLSPVWWRPDQATRLQACYGLHDYLSQRVLVDSSRAGMLRVYVFSSTDDFRKNTTQTPSYLPTTECEGVCSATPSPR